MPTDNLNPPPAPSRVYYSLGRMLGVDDFQADQDYHRGCLARALLQLCGTGTVAGLNVGIPQVWQPNTSYPASAFVYDGSQNVQVNTGVAGTSGGTPPAFNTTPGGSVTGCQRHRVDQPGACQRERMAAQCAVHFTVGDH